MDVVLIIALICCLQNIAAVQLGTASIKARGFAHVPKNRILKQHPSQQQTYVPIAENIQQTSFNGQTYYNGASSKSASLLQDRDYNSTSLFLEAVLCRHFALVFRVAACAAADADAHIDVDERHGAALTHGSLTTSSNEVSNATAGNSTTKYSGVPSHMDRSVLNESRPLCLWMYRLATSGGTAVSGGKDGSRSGGPHRQRREGSPRRWRRRRLLTHWEYEEGEEVETLVVHVEGRTAENNEESLRQKEQVSALLQREYDGSAVRQAVRKSQIQQQQKQRRRLHGQRRLLRGVDSDGQPAQAGKTAGHGSASMLTWNRDLSPYNSMWPAEALSHKAHLVALELCAQLAGDSDAASERLAAAATSAGAATGPRGAAAAAAAAAGVAPACVIVTDDVSWVAAGDGGAMERDILGRGRNASTGDGGSSKTDNSGVSNRTDWDRAVGASATTATLAAAAAASVTSNGPVPMPWRQNCTSGGGGDGASNNSSTNSCRMYDSHDAWLEDLSAGLRQHLSAGGTEPYAVHSSSTVGDGGPGGKGTAEWDVLALPSACVGWNIGVPAAKAHRTATADDDSEAGLPVLPQHYTIAGCVLAFNPRVVRTLLNLSTEAVSNLSSSAALFPMTNLPLFAKLGQLSRQGVIKMALAVPATEAAVERRGLADVASRSAATAAAAQWANALAPEPLLAPRRRFLIFTSAGDQGVWQMWAHPDRNYDIIVAYYGSLALKDPRAIAGAPGGGRPDHIYTAHGSKHQNLHRLHSLHPGILAGYEAVAVWDDDLQIEWTQVSAMFEHFSALSGPPGNLNGIWVAQPSLREGSKIDHVLLFNQPVLALLYTSFVEMNACIFRSDKLVEVLDSLSYTGELMGWGADYAYHAVLGPTERDRYAVMHDFQVLNPPNEAKSQGREILKLASQETRLAQWQAYSIRFNITPPPEVAYRCIPRYDSLPPEAYPTHCPEYRPPHLPQLLLTTPIQPSPVTARVQSVQVSKRWATDPDWIQSYESLPQGVRDRMQVALKRMQAAAARVLKPL